MLGCLVLPNRQQTVVTDKSLKSNVGREPGSRVLSVAAGNRDCVKKSDLNSPRGG